MTRLLTIVAALSLLLFGGTPPAVPSTQAVEETVRSNPPERSTAHSDAEAVAVLELFTSEGCSSCPPADRLLRSLVQSARTDDRPIYALSFHVDYWNRLGWEDPYSDPAYSERQRRYSQRLDVDTYTPQIVVNGRQAMVGSRSGEVQTAIKSALDTSARIDVDLDLQTTDGLAVTHKLTGELPEDATLRLAVVERGLSQDVSRGENAGRTLRHANVVRGFTTVPASRTGTTPLSIPDAVDRSQASVIGYVQSASWAVLGAGRIDLADGSASTTH